MSYRTSLPPSARAPSPGPSGRRSSFAEMSSGTTASGLPSLPSLPSFAPPGGYANSSSFGGIGGYGGGGAGGYYGYNSGSGAAGGYTSSSGLGSSLGGYGTTTSGMPLPPTFPSFDAGSAPPPMPRRESFSASTRRSSISSMPRRESFGGSSANGAMMDLSGYGANGSAGVPSGYAGNLGGYPAPNGNGGVFARQPLPPTPQMATGSVSPHNAQHGAMLPPISPPQQSAQTLVKKTTRQYRKKTPPEACAVCGTAQTPEWRKGPSGLRTLCNACGLTAAKQQPSRDAETIEEVWQQLTDIGMNRFRGNYTLSEERKAAAYTSWKAAKGSGQVARVGNRNPNYNAHPPPSARERPMSMSMSIPTGTPRNPNELEGAQALFSMSRGRGASFSEGHTPAHAHPYAQVTGVDMARAAAGYVSSNAHHPSSTPQRGPAGYGGRRGSMGAGGAVSPAGRMSISGLLNQDPVSRPSSVASNRSTASRGYGYGR